MSRQRIEYIKTATSYPGHTKILSYVPTTKGQKAIQKLNNLFKD